MKNHLLNIILKVIAYQLIFLVFLRVALIIIPHQENRLIYYINIDLNFLIACITWLNLKQSSVNRPLIIILGIWKTTEVIQAIFYIFTTSFFSPTVIWINYHFFYITITSYQLFITLYLFFQSMYLYNTKKIFLQWAIIVTSIITAINYLPIIISGDYLESLEYLFKRSYYMHIINFSLLVVFWHQYTQTKLIFSEYLSNIISVYTILIGLEILHAFSYQNDLLFTYFAQFFYAILYLVLIVLWIVRLNYLQKPESNENEDYIKNYYMLQGFVNKPRKGLLVTFYSAMNRTAIIITILVMVFLGIYLFSYDKFDIFIKLNILILLLAIVISAILAIVTWYKRWYDAMGFLFKKQKLNKAGK